MVRGAILCLATLLAIVLRASASAFAVTITVVVPGTSDPWLAGMPTGSVASIMDVAPLQSPVQVIGLPITPGNALTFSAAGIVANGPCGPPFCPSFGPDGGMKPDQFPLFHETGAENGISDIGSPINALVGVFLGATAPSLGSPPPTLDFNSISSQNYRALSPAVQQVFFIGDGLALATIVQQVDVPAGATRLYLGTMDGCCWSNNLGSFTVRVTEVPEPSTLVLFAIGMCGLLAGFRPRRACFPVSVRRRQYGNEREYKKFEDPSRDSPSIRGWT